MIPSFVDFLKCSFRKTYDFTSDFVFRDIGKVGDDCPHANHLVNPALLTEGAPVGGVGTVPSN